MKKSDSDLSAKEEFYKASSDWFYDMYQSHSLWLRRAIIAVIVLAVLLSASIITNLFLFPLKQKGNCSHPVRKIFPQKHLTAFFTFYFLFLCSLQ